MDSNYNQCRSTSVKNLNIKKCDRYNLYKIYDYLKKNNDQFTVPLSSYKRGISGTVDFVFEFGGIYYTNLNGDLNSCFMFTNGANPLSNKVEIDCQNNSPYIYVFLISKNFRGSRLYKKYISYMGDVFREKGSKIVMWSSDINDHYANKLYKKTGFIVSSIELENNHGGYLYASKIENWR